MLILLSINGFPDENEVCTIYASFIGKFKSFLYIMDDEKIHFKFLDDVETF